MPIIRLLILAAVIWLLYRLVRRLLPHKPAVTDQSESTHMVKCDLCGIYITSDAAYRKDKFVYCCKDHYLRHREEMSS